MENVAPTSAPLPVIPWSQRSRGSLTSTREKCRRSHPASRSRRRRGGVGRRPRGGRRIIGIGLPELLLEHQPRHVAAVGTAELGHRLDGPAVENADLAATDPFLERAAALVALDPRQLDVGDVLDIELLYHGCDRTRSTGINLRQTPDARTARVLRAVVALGTLARRSTARAGVADPFWGAASCTT